MKHRHAFKTTKSGNYRCDCGAFQIINEPREIDNATYAREAVEEFAKKRNYSDQKDDES